MIATGSLLIKNSMRPCTTQEDWGSPGWTRALITTPFFFLWYLFIVLSILSNIGMLLTGLLLGLKLNKDLFDSVLIFPFVRWILVEKVLYVLLNLRANVASYWLMSKHPTSIIRRVIPFHFFIAISVCGYIICNSHHF